MLPYLFQESPDYTDYLLNEPRASTLDIPAIQARRKEKKHTLTKKSSLQRCRLLQQNPLLSSSLAKPLPMTVDDQGAIVVGKESDISTKDSIQLKECLKAFMPWKKGPWNIYGHAIDAEWRCELRWQRLEDSQIFSSLSPSHIIADIGCHSGYELFRLSTLAPRCIIGFEPVSEHYYTYHIIQNLVRSPKLHFELFGYQELTLFEKFFDVIFCLGVLYHHTDPISLLRILHNSLASQGKLIIDCQGIIGQENTALMPGPRYMGCKGFWWLPTVTCLKTWLRRAGFHNIELLYKGELTEREQRRTSWADIPSLKEGLHTQPPSAHHTTLTKEGFPGPWRFYMCAYK
ncbi:MAG: tRNA 5-methoxyuridine(34)/uridine 5-oxyacetic acid(34) synthase CmoB [Proteobacteria bacterium]|nr:tRNA 5-methoxyuridine(34)/uridine 5-oxyacetic acid(34) synthase CmoB [Pseudomonadota bacterium]